MDESKCRTVDEIISVVHDEYTCCVSGLEQMLLDRFIFDEKLDDEQRDRNCDWLCSLFATISGSFNLSSVIRATDLQAQMRSYFGM